MARVYIHEFIDIIGGNRARYEHHMTANWVPEAAAARRQRCFGVWGTVGSTGRWPQVVNLWEYDGWEDLAHNFDHELVGARHQDPVLAEWWSVAAGFRSGGVDRILVAADWSPGIEELQSTVAGHHVAYVHELLRCPPGAARALVEAAAGHRDGAVPVLAAWRTAMAHEDEVLVLRGVPDWSAWARFEEQVDEGGDPWTAAARPSVLGRERILLVDAELAPLRIGRQPLVGDRRPLDEV